MNRIELYSPELLFLGESGQPYRGSVVVRYINGANFIDILAFKKFITSLQNTTMKFEQSAATIHAWVSKSTQSKAFVSVALTARGGIQPSITFGDDLLSAPTPVHQRPLYFQI